MYPVVGSERAILEFGEDTAEPSAAAMARATPESSWISGVLYSIATCLICSSGKVVRDLITVRARGSARLGSCFLGARALAMMTAEAVAVAVTTEGAAVAAVAASAIGFSMSVAACRGFYYRRIRHAARAAAVEAATMM